MSLLDNIKQSMLIKRFLINKDIRKEKTFEKNLNWGIKDKLPKVE